MPSATQFNQQFRDNHNELALHAHGGGSGSGASTLGGTAGLNWLRFRDAAAPGAPGGTLTAFYTSNGTFGWVNSGGTAFLGANSTHEHTGSWVQPTAGSVTGSLGITVQNVAVWSNGTIYTDTGSFLTIGGSSTFTLGGSGSRALVLGAFFYLSNQTAANRAFTLRAIYTLNGTGTTELTPDFVTTATGSAAYHYAFFATLTGQASGSYRAWTLYRPATAANPGNMFFVYSTISVAEFQIK